VEESKRLRAAGLPGYRPQVLARVAEAVQLDVPERDPVELRRLVASCLGEMVGLEPTLLTLPQEARSLALHPRGSQLLVGLGDGSILVHSLGQGPEMAALRGHQATVVALAFAPDGSKFLSADAQGTIKL